MKPSQHDPREAVLRNALQGLAMEIADRHTPPPATAVWLRAQRRARQRALARAALPLRIMGTLGFIVATIAVAFLLHETWSTSTFSPAATRSLLVWVAPAVVMVLASAVFLLRTGRNPVPVSTTL